MELRSVRGSSAFVMGLALAIGLFDANRAVGQPLQILAVNNQTQTISGTLNRNQVVVGVNSPNSHLIIQNGGQLNNNYYSPNPSYPGYAYIGMQPTGVGTVSVSGTWNNAYHMYVGYQGSGTLNIQGGGDVSSSSAYLGDLTGSTGTATVSGSGSTWSVKPMQPILPGPPEQAVLVVGNQGTGTLNIQNGADVSDVHGGYIGNSAGSVGVVNVTGSGSTWTTTGNAQFPVVESHVGSQGAGTLNISNGGSVSALFTTVGAYSTGDGAVNVDGAGSSWTNTYGAVIGSSGTGELTISNGGQVTTGGTSLIGHSNTGTAFVSGPDSRWTNNVGLNVGGQGTLNVSAGGLVSTVSSTVTGQVGIGDGGTFSASGNVTNSGLIEIATGGVVSASSVANTGVVINHGTLIGDITSTNGGVLGGTGLFDGVVTIGNGGYFAPGSSPGIANTTETIWNSGGTYLWEIADDGGSGFEWDLWNTNDLSINGPFSISLTTLTPSNDPGLLANWNPLLDYQWLIATASNGAFDVTGLGYLSLDTTGFLNNIGTGSFRLSSSLDGNSLYLNFDRGTEVSAVPEPSSLALLGSGFVGLIGAAARRRRKHAAQGE